MDLRNAPYALLLLIVAAAYFGAAEIGLSQAFLHANVSPVWPPTGVAIAAVLLLGYRISPAILLAAFAANLATGVTVATAGGIAIGNMLEAVTAVFLLRRFVGRASPFYSGQDAVRFVLIAGAISTTASATIGTVSLCFGGVAMWGDFGLLWITWWLGDGVGALVVAPLVLTWIEKSSERWSLAKLAEAALLALSLAAAASVLLRGVSSSKLINYSLWHLIIAFFLWAALRFGPRGVATTIALFSSIAVWSTRQGLGPFAEDSPNESLLLLQVFVAAVAVTFLVLAAIITERRRAEQALTDRLQEIETMMEVLPVGLFISQDRDGTKIVGNRAAREFLRMERGLGANLSLTAPDDEAPAHFRVLKDGQEVRPEELPVQRAAVDGVAVRNLELDIVFNDGEVKHELISALPLFDHNGTPRGAVASLMDITGRKHIEREREQLLRREQAARAEAEAANRAKDEFLATLSHELRTPLNAIVGWSEMLRQKQVDPSLVAHAIEVINRNAKSQARLIEDILDVSRIITGKFELDVRSVELLPVVRAAVDVVSPAARAKGIQVEKELDASVYDVVADPTRLQQIVWNLLSNAVKFTPKGGRVKVTVRRREADAEIIISDTGQGINQDFLPYIFDRFSQADNSRTRKHMGLGLGLAITRHLVEMHGGIVEAESEGEGRGSSFTVRLPLAVEKAGPHYFEQAFEGGEARAETPLLLKNLRVLLVDDHSDTREMLSQILRMHGAEVKAAASAREAFLSLQEWMPDVLVSDIGMPEEDGYSLIRKVRNLQPEQGGATPAIALTGYAGAEEYERASQAGFEMCLAKPVESTKLIESVVKLHSNSTREKRA